MDTFSRPDGVLINRLLFIWLKFLKILSKFIIQI